MKKLDNLLKNPLLPKQGTLDILLAYSKSMSVVKTQKKIYLISKN